MSPRIAQTSILLILVTAATAATGYLREFVLARTFGVGSEMDAFYFSLALIQASHDLLFGATLTATIVPLVHRRENGAPGAAGDPARFTLTVALTVVVLAGAFAVALRGALPDLIVILSPKMSAAVQAQCLDLSTVMVWLLPLNALMTLGVLTLNAQGNFIMPAALFCISNVIFIGVLLLARPVAGVQSLSIASVAGPACLLPFLAANLARQGLLRRLRPDLSRKFFAPVWQQARPILLTVGIGSSVGLVMIAHLIVRGFAADSGQGSIAALGYAYRLYEVPISLIANPAAILMLPNIAMLYRAGRSADIGAIGRQTLLAGLVVLFPAAVVTWAGADLIVHVFLQRGNFDSAAARLTADALRGFAPAIAAEGIIVVFYRFFYAIHRPNRAVAVSCVALVALLCLLFAFGGRAFIAVPLALSGAFLIAALALVYLLVREIGGGWSSLVSTAKWVVCALFGVAAWRLAEGYQTRNVWSELPTVLTFVLFYSAAVLVAFADYRRALVKLLGAFACQMRRIFGSA